MNRYSIVPKYQIAQSQNIKHNPWVESVKLDKETHYRVSFWITYDYCMHDYYCSIFFSSFFTCTWFLLCLEFTQTILCLKKDIWEIEIPPVLNSPTDSEGKRCKYNGGIYFPVYSNEINLVYSLLFTNLKVTTQLEPLKNCWHHIAGSCWHHTVRTTSPFMTSSMIP